MNSKLLYQLVDKPITGEWGQEGGLVKVIRTANFTNQGVINFSKVVQRDIADGSNRILIKFNMKLICCLTFTFAIADFIVDKPCRPRYPLYSCICTVSKC